MYRLSDEESVAAAVSRMAATLVSFVLCLVYLWILPFRVWGMAALIGIASLVKTLVGRSRDAVTTAVVMVAAALSPHNAWEQPTLGLADTVAGVAVGLATAWIGLRATGRGPQALSS